MLYTAGTERVLFFQDMLKTLQQGSTSTTYDYFLSFCRNVKFLCDQHYPDLHSDHHQHTYRYEVDADAKLLLPQGWKHMTPVKCYGDGNCLYRYMNLLKTKLSFYPQHSGYYLVIINLHPCVQTTLFPFPS